MAKQTGPEVSLVEIPPREGGRQGLRINPLLVGAISPYEAAGAVQVNKCILNVFGKEYKVAYSPDVVCDMLGLQIALAEDPNAASKGSGSQKNPAPGTPDKGGGDNNKGGSTLPSAKLEDGDL